MKKYLQLNNIGAYQIAFRLSNYIWNMIIKWNYFKKNTIGIQFVRAVDSVSANIAEGFGRYTKKDKVKFYRYSHGSVKESLDWNEKAKTRKLFNEKEYEYVLQGLSRLPKELNYLIKFTNDNLTM